MISIFKEGKFQDYLDTLAKFPRYSYKNSVLIHQQNANASLLLGKSKWQHEYGRTVENEEPIKIFAPSYAYKNRKVYKREADTNKFVLDDKGNKILEDVRVKELNWMIVDVYDISQTEGDAIVGLDIRMEGSVEDYDNLKNAIIQSSSLSIKFEKVKGLANGFCSKDGIVIDNTLSEKQTMSALIHELCHSILHINGEIVEQNQREVEAQAVSYAVLKHYGIDTDDYSFFYVASWSKGKKLSEMSNCLSTIQKTAKAIINDIDVNLEQMRGEKVLTKSKMKEQKHGRN